MTLRRRLVGLATLSVALPLLVAVGVGFALSGRVLAHRTYQRLDLAVVGAQQQLVARRDALARDVAVAAASSPAAVAPGLLISSGQAGLAAVVGADGSVLGSARAAGVTAAVPVNGPVAGELVASAPMTGQQSAGAGQQMLVGAIVLTREAVSSLSPSPSVSISLDPAPPTAGPGTTTHARHGNDFVSQLGVPDVGTLQAAASSGPVTTERRVWLIWSLLGALAIIVVVLSAGDAVLQTAARPLERLVDWAEMMATNDAEAAPLGDADVDRLARALTRVNRDLRSRAEELSDTRQAFRLSLERLGDVLSSTHDLHGIVEAVIDTALLAVPADAAVYYRLTGPPANLQAIHARGTVSEGVTLAGTGVAGRAAATGEPTVLPGPVALDPLEPPAVAAAAFPLRSLDRLVGVLCVYGTSVARPFNDNEIRALQTFVRQAEVAIANIELHTQAQRDALTDPLTGLWNRRNFDLRCRDAHIAAVRFGEPFSVMLVDVDEFKQINDLYDHFTGDAALVHLSRVLHRSSREVDVVARWGGEEFAVLVQRAGVEDALIVGERLRDNLRRHPLEYNGRTIAFTVSVGVAGYPTNGSTPADVVAAADEALLRAKATGKDRVVRAEDAPDAPSDIRVHGGRRPADEARP